MAGSQGGTAKKKRRTSRNFSTPVLHNSDVGSQHPECQMCNKSPFGDWSTFTVPGMPGMGLDGPGRLGLCCGSVDQASSGPVGMSFEGHGMMLSGFRPPMMVGHGEMIGPNHPIMMGHPDMQRPLFTPSDKVYPTHHPMIYNSHNPTGPPIYPCGVCRKEVNDNDQVITLKYLSIFLISTHD